MISISHNCVYRFSRRKMPFLNNYRSWSFNYSKFFLFCSLRNRRILKSSIDSFIFFFSFNSFMPILTCSKMNNLYAFLFTLLQQGSKFERSISLYLSLLFLASYYPDSNWLSKSKKFSSFDSLLLLLSSPSSSFFFSFDFNVAIFCCESVKLLIIIFYSLSFSSESEEYYTFLLGFFGRYWSLF